jgi:hypothetical protein
MSLCFLYRSRKIVSLDPVLVYESSPQPGVLFVSDTFNFGVPGSSVSIVSDCGLNGRGSVPDRGRGFFL